MANNPYYKGIKVKKIAVDKLKGEVKNGFYSKNEEQQEEALNRVIKAVCEAYSISSPKLRVGDFSECYVPLRQEIRLPKSSSWISMLHELRHHIQHQAGKQYKGHDIEEDARAWSLRVFKLGLPKSFEKSVKQGRILHIKWDGEKIVNSRGY